MLITFLTILASIYAVGFLLVLVVIFVAFLRLSSYQQRQATITVSPWGLLGFLVAVSFLGARLLG